MFTSFTSFQCYSSAVSLKRFPAKASVKQYSEREVEVEEPQASHGKE